MKSFARDKGKDRHRSIMYLSETSAPRTTAKARRRLVEIAFLVISRNIMELKLADQCSRD